MTDTTDSESIETAGGQVVKALTAILGDPAPGTVFSDPISLGPDLIVTAAAWERGGGFGMGGGVGDSPQGKGSGAGGGGGGGAQGRPVAVIRISPDRVQVQPVIDLTKIALTVLLAAIGVWRALRR
jgi:uncharacterized spore protein YtfJ